MQEIKVWAPKALKVELETPGHIESMQKDDSGWWKISSPLIQHGLRYAFRVDGKGPFPDPRSPWQPEGVHMPSCRVDHSRFLWTDEGFEPPPLESAIFYELHVGTFTKEGTFDSLIGHLDYLVELGITHIELMPVVEFSGNRGWGYDGVDLFAPHHAYGGPFGLKRLVNACHEKGLGIILDVVYNHLGPEGNYLDRFGPYFTNKYSTPWGLAVNFDGSGSHEVRRFIVDNALMWLKDYHFDGLRLDAVHAIFDMSAIHILEELATQVKHLQENLGRRLLLIAESDLNDPRIVRPQNSGGYGMDAQWNEDFHHALHAFLTGENNGYYKDFGFLSQLAKALKEGFVYDGIYSRYRNRIHGRTAIDVSPEHFVGFLQNHDQVGNRAKGERLNYLLSEKQLKTGTALTMTAPFLPLLFQGEEWAASTPFLFFTDHQDPALSQAVKKGRQSEFTAFGWNPDEIPDPQAEETFLKSKLHWKELQSGIHKRLLKWHRSLIQLRRSFPPLQERVAADFDESRRWLVMKRAPIGCIFNFANTQLKISLEEFSTIEILLKSEEKIKEEENIFYLPPWSVVIFSFSD